MIASANGAAEDARQTAQPLGSCQADLERARACARHKVALGLRVTAFEQSLLRSGIPQRSILIEGDAS
jgi:hypothetical protein